MEKESLATVPGEEEEEEDAAVLNLVWRSPSNQRMSARLFRLAQTFSLICRPGRQVLVVTSWVPLLKNRKVEEDREGSKSPRFNEAGDLKYFVTPRPMRIISKSKVAT